MCVSSFCLYFTVRFRSALIKSLYQRRQIHTLCDTFTRNSHSRKLKVAPRSLFHRPLYERVFLCACVCLCCYFPAPRYTTNAPPSASIHACNLFHKFINKTLAPGRPWGSGAPGDHFLNKFINKTSLSGAFGSFWRPSALGKPTRVSIDPTKV